MDSRRHALVLRLAPDHTALSADAKRALSVEDQTSFGWEGELPRAPAFAGARRPGSGASRCERAASMATLRSWREVPPLETPARVGRAISKSPRGTPRITSSNADVRTCGTIRRAAPAAAPRA